MTDQLTSNTSVLGFSAKAVLSWPTTHSALELYGNKNDSNTLEDNIFIQLFLNRAARLLTEDFFYLFTEE